MGPEGAVSAKEHLSVIKGYKAAPRSVRSRMDTILLTPAVVAKWKTPPFQRPLKINAKVLALAEALKQSGGVLPGVITLGDVDTDRYVVDGQHRVQAFLLSELTEGYADVRICAFDNLAEMGQEFVDLNSSLVRIGPDDVLRGLEGTHEPL